MQAVVKSIFKDLQHVEERETLINKKPQIIPEHFNIIIDEISDGRINQQTLWAGVENQELLKKLENLNMYQQVKFVVNINFFDGKPSKIIVLDLLEDDSEVQTVNEIFERVDQQQQEQRKKKEQE